MTGPHDSTRTTEAEEEALPPDLQLPRFIQQDRAGVYVNLSYFRDSTVFREFADHVFTHSTLLRGLNYPVFLRLAYDYAPTTVADEILACEAAGRPPFVYFANAIAGFPRERFALYRGVKVSGGRADYLFEPLMAERDGGATAVQLDFDEFVAQMWVKGVRFGLQEAAVRKAIAEGFVGRVTVACEQPATEGQDAGVEELADCLRRSDAPATRPDGKVNLARFSNRFPQVRAGMRLLRKTPLELGQPGHKVDGTPLAPAVPKDLDFSTVAGEGTVVERDAGGEYLVTTMDGFLDIDHDTNRVSVTEKMINRAGVSLRTTGDISLRGENYEEHGEIQEGRVVEGYNITALADVFGRLESNGGAITIAKNLTGGSVVNHGGTVVVEGRASGATILAPGGEVRLGRAEGTLVVARRVVVTDVAAGCDIQADTADLERIEGCSIGATDVSIAQAGAFKQNETLVTMLLPALDEHERALARVREQLAELDAMEAEARAVSDRLQRQPEVANFLSISAKVRRGEVTLTAQQQAALKQLAAKVAPALRDLSRIGELAKKVPDERAALQSHIDRIEADCRAARAAVKCNIEVITGETIVRALPRPTGAKALHALSPNDIRQFLHATPPGARMIFAGAQGAVDWTLAPREGGETPAA